MNKLLILTAPSGAGKTTIVRHLLKKFPQLAFSVSATTRAKRPREIHGKDYYFLSIAEFEERLAHQDFLEWEEVYSGKYYGTLKSEVERLWAEEKCVVFDIDVKGATNVKKTFPVQTLAIFVKPPSFETLVRRLEARKTEDDESFRIRLERARKEMTYKNNFDVVLLNDVLSEALEEAEKLVATFLKPNAV